MSPSITIINGTDLFVVPEFIATHIHLINGGTNLSSFQFRKISSREQFTQAIETFVSNFEKEKWTFHESNWNYTRLEGIFLLLALFFFFVSFFKNADLHLTKMISDFRSFTEI